MVSATLTLLRAPPPPTGVGARSGSAAARGPWRPDGAAEAGGVERSGVREDRGIRRFPGEGRKHLVAGVVGLEPSHVRVGSNGPPWSPVRYSEGISMTQATTLVVESRRCLATAW
jgi:hypothetical protein